jgi:hypothetical protein
LDVYREEAAIRIYLFFFIEILLRIAASSLCTPTASCHPERSEGSPSALVNYTYDIALSFQKLARDLLPSSPSFSPVITGVIEVKN